MPVEFLHRFEKLMNTKIYEGYGLTEAPVCVENPYGGSTKPGSIGLPIPEFSAKILESDGNEVAAGGTGELLIKGPGVMKGYLNRPQETGRTIQDGWLYTGDIARMDEDGYVYIVDRKKDLVIRGGYNVYPREIDEVLYQHPKIAEAVAVGIADEYRGETVKAFVVPKEGETLTEEDIIGFCKEKLAAYKAPKIVEFRDELPKSAVGKILRKVLRDEEAAKQEK